jgi:hypothetical protein
MRLLLTFLGLAFSLHAAERSNVIFILADDLGYDEVGGHGPRLEVPVNTARTYPQTMRGSLNCRRTRAAARDSRTFP